MEKVFIKKPEIKVEVLNKKQAIERSFNNDIEDCIIISITDLSSSDVLFKPNPHIKAICRLKFNDCDIEYEDAIKKEDGKKIIDFVNKNINKANKIIVHCDGGVSRSAGVGAALLKILTGDDMEIFNNPKFYPNMACYRKVLEAYFGSYNETEAKEKEAHNLKLWRESNGLD